MSRKRKSDQAPTEITTDNILEDGVAAVAEPPVNEPPVAEPSVDEPRAEGQTFADKVGKKKWVPDPDPFPIVKDNLVGVGLFLSKRDRQMAIKFGDGSPKDKPSQAVIDTMHAAGCKWKSANRIWALAFSPESERRTHIEAERLYQEVCQMIRREKGIDVASPDMTF
jgi:hypothetical protein